MKLCSGLGFTSPNMNRAPKLLSGFTGQSLNDYLFTQHSAAGRDAYETLASSVLGAQFIDMEDSAQGATFLTKTANEAITPGTNEFWWNDITNAPGPIYTAQKANLLAQNNAALYTVIDWRQGTADSEQISSGALTRATYKTALLGLLAQMHTDFPNAVFSVGILHRHKARADAGHQAIREVQWEVISELSYAYFGHEIYDIDLTDNVHLTSAGNILYGQRAARRHIALTGNGDAKGTLGPQITTATLKTDVIDLEITHDDGTDLTIPGTAATMRVDVDGTYTTPSSLTKVSASLLRLQLPEGTAPALAASSKRLLPFYGAQTALASTSPAVVKDNAVNAMPLQSQPIALANADPVQALDNLAFYIDARGSAKTYSSGVSIQSIARIAGSVTQATSLSTTANEATYDSAAFSNAGGISVPDNSTQMHYGPFTPGAVHSIGFVIDIPSTAPDNSAILAFANSSGGADNQAKISLRTTSGGRLAWDLNEESASIGYTMPFTASGSKRLILLEFSDASTLKVYIDDWSSPATNLIPATTLDPRDDYIDWDYMSLFKRGTTDSPTGLKLGALFHTTDLLSGAERGAIASYWASRFNL